MTEPSRARQRYGVCVPGDAGVADDGFGEVLYYFDWWDCPRFGVARVDGEPMMFDSPFDEDLDDYAAEFLLWSAPDEEIAEGLAVWRAFTAWRERFDSGKRPLRPFEATRAGRLHQQRSRSEPPPTARRAIPEWRLDPDRSFVGRVPKHRVRWQFVD